MTPPRVWLITGTSTGFGRYLAEHVLEKGERVVATVRNPSSLDDLKTQHPADRLLIAKVDVTQPHEIQDAFAQAKAAFGRVDVVVNNAGFAVIGEVEATADADARALFETNFWGAANVSREAVRFFRDENAPGVGGRLLQISSMLGVAGWLAWGYFSATKFALEGLTEALASELDPDWNIKITLIEPGAFGTAAPEKNKVVAVHPAYTNPDLPISRFRQQWESAKSALPGDARKAAQRFYEVAGLPDPPLHLPLGKDAVALVREKASQLTADVNKYEYLSQDLLVDN